jgi:hypothetical protein
MSEGNVYLCTWRKMDAGFTIALKRDSTVHASGETFDEAEEEMWDVLSDRFADGEAVVEYVKPRPRAEGSFVARYGKPELVVVSGNDYAGKLLNAAALHPKGYCRNCRWPLETAAGVVPEFDWLPSGDGIFSHMMSSMYSEEFLSLFTTEEMKRLKFEPVHGQKRKKKKHFRLAGDAVADYVGVPRFEGLLNDQCRECKRRLGICYLRNCRMYQFVALADLPQLLPTVFAIGRGNDLGLCMQEERYMQMVGEAGTRKITSRKIWVVPDDKFVRTTDETTHPLETRWAGARFFPDLE